MRAALVLVAGMSVAVADPPKPNPAEPAPNALVLVFDRSSSMQDLSLDAAKAATLKVASTLRPDDQIAVVTFDSEPTVIVPLQPSKNRAQIAKQLHKLRAGGGTNLFPGLREADELLTPIDAKVKHVIVLSHGDLIPDGLHELVREMREHEITISTVGVQGAEEVLLKQISKDGGGRYYNVADVERLSKTYVDEAKRAFK
jgi:Ca-activated chloride channel homolog